MKMKELNGGQDERKDYFYSLLDFHLKKNDTIHVEVKENDRFYNGKIVSIADDMFILNDMKLGDMPVFFSQIKLVEVYKEK